MDDRRRTAQRNKGGRDMKKPRPQAAVEAEGRDESVIEGRNAVTEALRAGRTLNKVFIASGDTDAGLKRLAAMARDAGAVVVETDRRKLDQMSATGAHQGIIARAAVKGYSTVREILDYAASKNEPPLIIICDEVSDGHNLGAIIRTGECVGAHGVIIPKRRSASLDAVVAKTSAGAAEYMRVARVANLAQAIDELKDAGVWIYGTAADGADPLWQTDLRGPMALVIGSEGEGMRRLVAEKCDFGISIPMKGHISSLNASASAAIVLYEALRQRSAG